MTKKDYETIANALKPFYKEHNEFEYGKHDLEREKILEIILAISKALSKDNPKFNPVRFLDYMR